MGGVVMSKKFLTTTVAERANLKCFSEAEERAKKGKSEVDYVKGFEKRRNYNLIRLVDEIRAGTYRHGEYYTFFIKDPKRREIMAAPFRDRIVHQWLVSEFLIPFYVPRFIEDSYACIQGRGVHRAIGRAQFFTRKMRRAHPDFYILKMDISKFFNSIDRDILYGMIARKVRDPALRDLIRLIIDSETFSSVGIPIGNLTSQYFANIYLDRLDQYVKHTLKVKYYVRYMDDFIIWVEDKGRAAAVYEELRGFVEDSLNLRLNSKSRYFPGRLALDFCGRKIYHDHSAVRRRSKRAIVKIKQDFLRSAQDEEEQRRFLVRTRAWFGHVQHADAFYLTRRHLGRAYAALLYSDLNRRNRGMRRLKITVGRIFPVGHDRYVAVRTGRSLKK
jgi:retron-type reverse transcriptase